MRSWRAFRQVGSRQPQQLQEKMERGKTKPFDDWVLYITNHFTHPVIEAQAASPRFHLARKLSERGQKLLVYCPIGRHVGNPIRDFITNLFPKKVSRGNTVYLFPPVIVSPASATTVLTLIMGTVFILAYLSLTRVRVAAQYSTSMLVGPVGAAIRSWKKIPFVANYGDPDFARERGASRKAFRFCEDYVMARKKAYAIVYIDEVIGEYVKREFGVRRTMFLPNGGYELGSKQAAPDDPVVNALRSRLALEGKRVVIYAGQISKGYKFDILVPAASSVLRQQPDAVFLIIGEGPALPGVMREVKDKRLEESFRFLGAVAYDRLDPYLALSEVGLQLLPDMCMGTKVLMYMAHSVAVVSVGAWFDRYHVFLRNGQNVILVPPKSEELGSQLVRILSDPGLLSSVAREGRLTVEPYSWDRHAEDTLSLLREAADSHRLSRR